MTDILEEITITSETPVQPETVQADATQEPVKKKRGRKPNTDKAKNKMYFSDEEEEAFRVFCLSTNEIERNRIFNKTLYPAFTKMIESIIRRYTLFKPGEEFEDTFNDTMSFLMTKVSHYKPDKNKKAYSYCGTICKNYLMHERINAQKRMNRDLSYDTVYNELNPDNRQISMNVFNEPSFNQRLMSKVATEIEKMVNNPLDNNLNEIDVKVGLSLVEILRNWDNLFDSFGSKDSKKYNKSSVDSFIKESTLLTTKQIRDSKKKFTSVYFNMKDDFLNKNNYNI